ncbi:MAG: hypothetical protein VB934_01265, partial [Polyangiaceae bacterium]
LAIELGRELKLTRAAIGPLREDLVRVWIDVPRSNRTLIEVRRTGRGLALRSLPIQALTADAAARLVAIVTSEMVRVQARARRPVRPPPGQGSAPPSLPRIELGADIGALLTPGQTTFAWLGSGVSLAHHMGSTIQQVYGRFLARHDADGRWIEFGVRADVGQSPRPGAPWSLRAGAQLGAANIRTTAEPSAWSPTMAGRITSHHQLGTHASLALTIEPGVAWTLASTPSRSPKATLGVFATIATLH